MLCGNPSSSGAGPKKSRSALVFSVLLASDTIPVHRPTLHLIFSSAPFCKLPLCGHIFKWSFSIWGRRAPSTCPCPSTWWPFQQLFGFSWDTLAGCVSQVSNLLPPHSSFGVLDRELSLFAADNHSSDGDQGISRHGNPFKVRSSPSCVEISLCSLFQVSFLVPPENCAGWTISFPRYPTHHNQIIAKISNLLSTYQHLPFPFYYFESLILLRPNPLYQCF